MLFPNCQIKSCKNKALISYGGRWICGACMNKVLAKQREQQEKELEGLEDVGNS